MNWNSSMLFFFQAQTSCCFVFTSPAATQMMQSQMEVRQGCILQQMLLVSCSLLLAPHKPLLSLLGCTCSFINQGAVLDHRPQALLPCSGRQFCFLLFVKLSGFYLLLLHPVLHLTMASDALSRNMMTVVQKTGIILMKHQQQCKMLAMKFHSCLA